MKTTPASPRQSNDRPPTDDHYGDYRIRTDDPLLAKQVLYQLS